jgi:hypothetical protein
MTNKKATKAKYRVDGYGHGYGSLAALKMVANTELRLTQALLCDKCGVNSVNSIDLKIVSIIWKSHKSFQASAATNLFWSLRHIAPNITQVGSCASIFNAVKIDWKLSI